MIEEVLFEGGFDAGDSLGRMVADAGDDVDDGGSAGAVAQLLLAALDVVLGHLKRLVHLQPVQVQAVTRRSAAQMMLRHHFGRVHQPLIVPFPCSRELPCFRSSARHVGGCGLSEVHVSQLSQVRQLGSELQRVSCRYWGGCRGLSRSGRGG